MGMKGPRRRKLESHAPTEIVALSELKEHPRNYREHPDDQLEHIAESLRIYGVYRNVVVARDNTILAGHGVVRAASKLLHMRTLPVIRLPIDSDSPAALKLLTGDNEIGHLGLIDDRILTELLKELHANGGLLGTGYDEQMLAALAMVTRPGSELADFEAASEWVGMPEYSTGADAIHMTIQFKTPAARARFAKKAGIDRSTVRESMQGKHWSAWWPAKKRADPASVKLTAKKK